MAKSAQARQPRTRRPGRPAAVVLLGLAAILSLWAAFQVVATLRSPPPPAYPENYGPFGDGDLIIGFGILILALAGAGWWSATRASERGITRVLTLLIACGPLGWALAWLDSGTLDLINSIGSAGAIAALLLLVLAPLVTVVAIVAAVAECVSALWHRGRASIA